MKKKKKTIGIVCSPWLGGSGIVGTELANYLSKTGQYNLVFIGLEFPLRLNTKDVAYFKVDQVHHALFNAPLDESALTHGIVQAVKEYKIDILHAHFAIPFGYCALQAKEILKNIGIPVKVVTTLHGTDVLTLGKNVPETMKYVLNQSDGLTAVSRNLRDLAKNLYKISRKIPVIHNFIDFDLPEFNNNRPLSRKKFAADNELLFVHISNFRAIKRLTDTIDVFFRVNKALPSKLLLIGEGPELDVVKKTHRIQNDMAQIHFVGKVANPYNYLQLADGLIITSEYESFCLVGLEAMSFGVPVFSTDVGGISEVVKHGKTGYLAPLGDTKMLASYVVEHFKNKEKTELFKEQAIEHSKLFDAKRIIPQYVELYDSLSDNFIAAEASSFKLVTP